MTLSEGGGREVLEVARKRLTAANSQATAAKQMLASAQSMYDAAEKERMDAQSSLEEAEKKYEVINIDDDEPMNSNAGSNKRRKVSLSPQSQSNNNNSTSGNNTTATQNIAAAGSRTNNIVFDSSITAPTITWSSSTELSTLIVGGCGLSEVNGTYTRAAPRYNCNGAPVYSKQGRWKGNAVVYAIYWRSATKRWHIGHRQQDVNAGRGVDGGLCCSQPNVSRLAPPGNGWSMIKTSAVTPSSSFVNQVVVSGCNVVSALNGVYKQENGSLFEGAPLFTKQVGLATFAIYRVPSNQSYWYISRWDKTLNEEIPSSRIYKSNLYIGEGIPPENGWVSCSQRYASQQVPTCLFLSKAAASSAAATAVNELVVSGCGFSIANGTYKRATQTFKGLPMYKKTAGQITVTISSNFDEKRQNWGIYDHGILVYMSEKILRVDGKLQGAPLDNSTWRLTNDVIGVHPPPQVKRG